MQGTNSRLARSYAAIVLVGALVGATLVLILRWTSDSLPVQSIDYYELESESVAELTDRAEVVFVGTVAGYNAGVFREEPDPEDPDTAVTILDGISFDVVESLKGEPGKRFVVVTPSLLERDGKPISRIEQRPIQVFESNGRTASDARYLVFASEIRPGVYAFYGSGGAARVSDRGVVLAGVGPPFVPQAGAKSVVGERVDDVLLEIRERAGARK